MNDHDALQYAWKQLSGKLGLDKMTVGEKSPLHCFFLYGWSARTACDQHKNEEQGENK